MKCTILFCKSIDFKLPIAYKHKKTSLQEQ